MRIIISLPKQKGIARGISSNRANKVKYMRRMLLSEARVNEDIKGIQPGRIPLAKKPDVK